MMVWAACAVLPQGIGAPVVFASEPEPQSAPSTAARPSRDITDTMFSGPGLLSATQHANEMTMNYGALLRPFVCHCCSTNDSSVRRSYAYHSWHPEPRLIASASTIQFCTPPGHLAGVKILSINIISAKPQDDSLMNSLAQGAVAAAEARQAETAAYGRARALEVEAEGKARARIIEVPH